MLFQEIASLHLESETDMMNALDDVKKNGCNALCVYLGNFGSEIAETLLAKYFDGPVMFSAAAEESQSSLGITGRGDAYCGMLNASYNLALRNTKAWIPENPTRDAEGVADNIHDFIPIKQLYNLDIEIEEESELDLFAAYEATLLDINNSVPKDMYEESIKGKFDYDYKLTDVFMGFHCGNTCSKRLINPHRHGAVMFGHYAKSLYFMTLPGLPLTGTESKSPLLRGDLGGLHFSSDLGGCLLMKP